MSTADTSRHLHFDALAIEGGLFPAEWLARVAALEAPHQHADDYAIPRGLTLRDEIGRAWRIAQAVSTEFQTARARAGHDAEGATRRFVQQLLAQAFGHADLASGQRHELTGREYPITLQAQAGLVPVIVAAHDEALDERQTRFADGSRRRSAFGLLQEYLNASDACLWGVACNGLVLRVARDNASLTRPAWLEVDLERLFAEDRYADFSVLWLMLHASRFGRAGQSPQDAPLEAWRNAAREEGTRARDALRDGVEAALSALGQGFLSHPANADLRQALAEGRLDAAGYFNQLLRLVYRLIFLLTVEERGLLHPPGADLAATSLYAQGYGLRRLRERALRAGQHDRHADGWEALKPVFRGLASGEPRLALPPLGGLFAAAQCPDLDAGSLENRHLLAGVYRLAWLRDGSTLARVNWKDMGPEELGSVYESLLELVPEVRDDAREFRFAPTDATRGNARRLSGSYYTPDPLVQQLLDSALEPVIAQRLAAHPDAPERALLELTVLDPACGSGHFLLGAARRIAAHLARQRAGGTPTAMEYRMALREVVTHCLYGVDRNPMALELARIALWLEAFTPERPLGFLDHHLVCGDALLGLIDLSVVRNGIPDEAFKVLSGDARDACDGLRARNRSSRRQLEAQLGQGSLDFGARDLGQAFADLDNTADDSLDAIARKQEALATLQVRAAADQLQLAADLYLGAFLARKTTGTHARTPTSADLVHLLLGNGAVAPEMADFAHETCRASRVLHWRLAFPQVFARGGFDVVLGNPPWERIKLEEKEYFASRAPHVARARNAAARRRAIDDLAAAAPDSPDRAMYEGFLAAKHDAEAASTFCHSEARYPLTGTGDVNTYALFAETALALIGPTGRAGLVLPTGIATDDSTKAYFGHVSQGGRLVSLVAYDNAKRVFPAIHPDTPFCLQTVGTTDTPADLIFYALQHEHVADRRRHFSLSGSDFRLINPNTRTCPVFRSERDAELTRKIYRHVPVLIDETRPGREGNPWGISFMAMFHMSNDSSLFGPLDQGMAPLYEAKMIHQFDHRWATYVEVPDAGPTTIDVSDAMKSDPNFTVSPRYCVPRADVEARLAARGWSRNWLMGWRDITNGTNERTVIASVLPRVGVGNKVPLILANAEVSCDLVASLCGSLCSLALDYAARQKIGGTTLNYFLFKQLPVLAPVAYSSADLRFIVHRVLELTYTAADLTGWARDLGHSGPPFAWDPARRALLRAELDAWYARAYGLTRDELRFILDPAEVLGDDYPTETFRVLKQNEQRQYGEYRTRRLVLDAWDRLAGQHGS